MINELMNKFGKDEVVEASAQVLRQRKIDQEDHLAFASTKDFEESTGEVADPDSEYEAKDE
jgi:hypothetical protein